MHSEGRRVGRAGAWRATRPPRCDAAAIKIALEGGASTAGIPVGASRPHGCAGGKTVSGMDLGGRRRGSGLPCHLTGATYRRTRLG